MFKKLIVNPKIQDRLKNQKFKIKSDRQLQTNKPDRWEDFARTCKIRSGDRVVNFDPYYYQIELINQIQQNQTTVICKTRQLGKTETITNYFLWKAINNPGYLAVIFSRTQSDTSNIAKRIRRTIDGLNLPTVTDSVTDIQLGGGGRLLFRNSTKQGARGLPSVSDILYDEGAFVEHIEDIYTASIPCTSMLGDKARIIILSTPNGQSGWYWEMLTQNNGDRDIVEICDRVQKRELPPIYYWIDSVGACKFICHWLAHPKYSQQDNYLESIKKRFKLSDCAVQQEYNLSFSHSEAIVFPSELIAAAAIGFYSEPNFDNGYYFAGLDTSTVGDNYTVFSIVKRNRNGLLSLECLYRERGKSFQYHIDRISESIELYQPHCIAIESNSGGAIFLEKLQEIHLGFNFLEFKTTNTSKQTAIDRLLLELENRNLIFPGDSIVLEEFRAFRRNDKKLEAATGKTDDIIMSLAINLSGIAATEN